MKIKPLKQTLGGRFWLASALGFLLGNSVLLAESTTPFVVVFVDAKTEAKLGPFPYDRKIYADAVRALRNNGARAVVFKYFLDQSKSEEGDAALEQALKLLPSFLQARLDPSEKNSNPLPRRFTIQNVSGAFDNTISADGGWIPLEKFAQACKGIGFVDIRYPGKPLKIPLVERYKGNVVPSLQLRIAQFIFGGKIRAVDGKYITVGKKTLAVDIYNEIEVEPPAADNLNAIS